MLRDDGFSSKAKVDRYGRKLPKDSGRQDLKRYYRLEGNAEEDLDDDQEIERELERANARDEGLLSSSSDESSSDDEDVESAEDEVFGLLDGNAADGEAVPMGEASPRIAVVNLDWDNIRATDLMAVFSSFVPSGGRILRISIYPSDFGKERMEREEMEGPPKEIFGQEKSEHDKEEFSNSEGEDTEELDEQDEEEKIKNSLLKEDKGEEFNSTKLRRYQIERLRYYFAVIVCSSTSVAQLIYDAVDGTEYLTTANFFDLRFIPDDVEFTSDTARDECERVPDGYKPNEFVTDALQHSKVRLTWDADDRTRKEAQKRAFGGSRAEIDENDLKAYIGSDSSDDESPNVVPEPVVIDATSIDNPVATSHDQAVSPAVPKLSKKDTERQRMRALLGLDSESAPKQSSKKPKDQRVGDMQITFSSGLSGTKRGSVFENEPERDETTAEKYIRKEKERKKRRKEKLKNAREGGSGKVADNEDVNETKSTAPNSSDLGFEDPFFTAPSAKSASLKAKKRAQRRSDLASAAAETTDQREELEQLIRDESAANGKPVQHFDTNLLAKGEKLSSKKGLTKKKHKISERQREALAAKEKDDFRIDTQDPRFSAVFERSEFAIDPSHKGFKGTEGMKALLEAGRKKRGRDRQEVDSDPENSARRKKQKGNKKPKDGDELKSLVDKVKGRSKAL